MRGTGLAPVAKLALASRAAGDVQVSVSMVVAPSLRFMGTGKDIFPGNKLGMVRESEEPGKKAAELKIGALNSVGKLRLQGQV